MIATLTGLFQHVWHKGKGLLLVCLLLTVLIGLAPAATLWLSKEMINEVALLIQKQTNRYLPVFILLVLQFTVTLLTSVLMSVQTYANGKLSNVLEHSAQMSILQKISDAPLFYFDLPEFYNHLERVHPSAGSRLLSPFKNMLEIARALITMFSFLVFLLSVHWSLLLLSLLAAGPILLVQMKYGRKNFSLRLFLTPLLRHTEYTRSILKDRQAAKEIRLFGLSDLLLRRWSEAFQQQFTETMNVLRKQQKAEISLDALSALFYSGAAVILVCLIRTTPVQIGQFVVIGQAVQGMQGLTNQVSTLIGKVFEELLYVKDYFAFLEYRHPEAREFMQGKQPFPAPLQQGITIDNLSYRYVDTVKPVLQKVRFHIKPGEKVAIVGENGSGKTTLVKCLMGFYPLTDGDILFDGMSISTIEPADLYRNMTVLFQDFIKYAFTLRENIQFGEVGRMGDTSWMKEVAATTGVSGIASELPNGYETYLGRFLQEGEDLSGGQWQKIALARALFRDGDIIILDEPTAALDPMTELEVYQLVQTLTANKTAIYISHRMAAARMADRIIVMEQGTVAESGTHAELMTLGGVYAKMYESQAKWYV